MEEQDLIVRYLEKKYSKVKDVYYYNDYLYANVSGVYKYVGGRQGIEEEKGFFFGNVQLEGQLSGAITLTGVNMLYAEFVSVFKGELDIFLPHLQLGIGAGLSLLGDGSYFGVKRFYGLGFNKVALYATDVAAAAISMKLNYNGILYVMT